MSTRLEHDSLGFRDVPAGRYDGIHALRAREAYAVETRPVPEVLWHALVLVKRAAAAANGAHGFLEAAQAAAIVAACDEALAGRFAAEFTLPAVQGGAGTACNMLVNEVLANRACELLGGARGEHTLCHPNDHVNRFQSTNDVYPTALRIAALGLLDQLEAALAGLQTACQAREREWAGILKLGRTELMDAVPMALGQAAGAWAEAFARDRWRVATCRERLRQVNLGGTAIGTGTGAPRAYLHAVIEELRRLTGQGLARAENPVDATQNADVFVEVSGILKAAAVNLCKVAGDLRLLSSGPAGGLGELVLAPQAAGSSLMPGKVNPVIPELAAAVGIEVLARDAAVTAAAAAGQLELNAFLPVIAVNLLEAITLLRDGVRALDTRCVATLRADEGACARHLAASHALATLLVPHLGYDTVAELVAAARARGVTVREVVLERGLLSAAGVDAVLDARAATAPGIAGAEVLRGRLDAAGPAALAGRLE